MARKRRFNNKKRRKKGYVARLRDRSINTLVESRIKSIAQDLDNKQMEYYVERAAHLLPGQIWPANDTWPATATAILGNPGQLYYEQICQVGGFLSTDLASTTNPEVGPSPDMACSILLKKIGVSGRFLNQGITRAQVDVSIWRVPFDKTYLASRGHSGQPVPSKMDLPVPYVNWISPFTLYNTATHECKKMFKESKLIAGGPGADPNPRFGSRVRIAHSRFTLPVCEIDP